MALKAIRAMAKYSKDKDALWGIQAGTAATPVSGSIWQYLAVSGRVKARLRSDTE